VPLTQDQLDTYEHKLRKRGFRRDDVLLHECPDCAAKAVLTYVIAGLETRQEDPSFDLEAFLR